MYKDNIQPDNGNIQITILRLFSIIVYVSIHLCLIAVTYINGYWWGSLAWLLGMFSFFPFFASLRPLLEHRDLNADSKSDYTKNDHGAFTRIFGSDMFSSTFGGAGFNRHLLHHWEPQLSYTNLSQLESFLNDSTSTLKYVIDARRSSYMETFFKLFEAAKINNSSFPTDSN